MSDNMRNKNMLIRSLVVDDIKFENPDRDRKEVLFIIKEYPDIVDALLAAKDTKDAPLFSAKEINAFLYNCSEQIIEEPKNTIIDTLNNKESIEKISRSENKPYELALESYGSPFPRHRGDIESIKTQFKMMDYVKSPAAARLLEQAKLEKD